MPSCFVGPALPISSSPVAGPTAAPTPSLPAGTASLSYARYTAGADPDAVLELTCELHEFFEDLFSLSLVSSALSALQPVVLLTSVPELGRTDWPWLSDEDVDAVEAWCQTHLSDCPSLACQIQALLVEALGEDIVVASNEPVLKPTICAAAPSQAAAQHRSPEPPESRVIVLESWATHWRSAVLTAQAA